MTALVILGFVIAATICSLTIWVLTLKFKEPPVTIGEQKFVNFMPQYSDGFGKGNIIKIIRGSKRIGIRFMPTDVDLKKLKDDKTLVVKPQLIWLEHKTHVAKGELSANQDELWGLPPTSSDFTDEFKSSTLGQALMTIIEDKNEKRTVERLLMKRMASLSKIAEMTAGNEIIDDYSEKVQEIMNDMSKLSGKAKSTSLFGATDDK